VTSKGYKFIEHTSDIIVEATGKTFSEAFENLAAGMFTQMGEAKPKEKIDISAKGSSSEVLVVNALSELLAEIEIERFTPSVLKVKKADLEKNEIEFEILGESKQPKNIIKAVTFHELIVKQEKNNWIIRVLFDI